MRSVLLLFAIGVIGAWWLLTPMQRAVRQPPLAVSPLNMTAQSDIINVIVVFRSNDIRNLRESIGVPRHGFLFTR